MTEKVERKLDVTRHADPMGRPAEDDPWAAFRSVETLEMTMEFRFRHSLGKLSSFFLSLEEGRLLATRCPRCRKVWMPPRVHCGDDLAVTEWIEISGRGTLEVATSSAIDASREDAGEIRKCFGYIRLDGADTSLFHEIRLPAETPIPTAGTRMKAVWSRQAVAHPMRLFWFEPE